MSKSKPVYPKSLPRFTIYGSFESSDTSVELGLDWPNQKYAAIYVTLENDDSMVSLTVEQAEELQRLLPTMIEQAKLIVEADESQ